MEQILPNEIQILILENFGWKELLKVSIVCKLWRELAMESKIWYNIHIDFRCHRNRFFNFLVDKKLLWKIRNISCPSKNYYRKKNLPVLKFLHISKSPKSIEKIYCEELQLEYILSSDDLLNFRTNFPITKKGSFFYLDGDYKIGSYTGFVRFEFDSNNKDFEGFNYPGDRIKWNNIDCKIIGFINDKFHFQYLDEDGSRVVKSANCTNDLLNLGFTKIK